MKLAGDDSFLGILILVLIIAKVGALALCSFAMVLLFTLRGWSIPQGLLVAMGHVWSSKVMNLETEAISLLASQNPDQSSSNEILSANHSDNIPPPLGGGIIQQDIGAQTGMAFLPKPSASMVTNDMVCPPLAGFTLEELPSIVSSPYDPPPPGSDERHEGVDFAFYNLNRMKSIQGLPIHSILPGKVAGLVNNRPPYGNMIMIETSYPDVSADLAAMLGITPQVSLYHVYAHMATPPQLELGHIVKCGEYLGDVGNTGTIVPHLHLETRHGPVGAVFPTMAFYDQVITYEERDNYLYWRISGAFLHFDPMSIFSACLRKINNQ